MESMDTRRDIVGIKTALKPMLFSSQRDMVFRRALRECRSLCGRHFCRRSWTIRLSIRSFRPVGLVKLGIYKGGRRTDKFDRIFPSEEDPSDATAVDDTIAVLGTQETANAFLSGVGRVCWTERGGRTRSEYPPRSLTCRVC